MDKQIMISARPGEFCYRCRYFQITNILNLSGICTHPDAEPIVVLYADDNCTLFDRRKDGKVGIM